MKHTGFEGPQHSFLFKIIAFLSRLQFSYQIRKFGLSRFLVVAFVFFAGAGALGIISLVAYLSKLPLLFPQLGPSAFILFYTPLAESACPRNVVLSHTVAVMVGLIALWTVHSIYPQANLADPSIMNKTRIMVIALSMGMIGVCMVTLNFAHPPAAASALLAAMGYFETPRQLLGVECAVVLLVLEAIVFNRIIGGLPYPLWRFDAKTARNFGQIAGIPSAEMTFWRQRAMKTFERR